MVGCGLPRHRKYWLAKIESVTPNEEIYAARWYEPAISKPNQLYFESPDTEKSLTDEEFAGDVVALFSELGPDGSLPHNVSQHILKARGSRRRA